MKTENRVWSFVAFLIALSLLMLCAPVWAGGDRNTSEASAKANSHVEVGGVTVPVTTGSMTTGNVSSGDVNVGGDSNRAYAVGNSMGDVDMGACYGSKQWNTPVYGRQGYSMLLVQCAERLDALGLHLAAALMRCSDETYAGLFVSRTECLQLSTIPKDVSVPQPTAAPVINEEHEHHEELTRKYEALEQRYAKLQRQTAIIKREVHAPQVNPVVQQEISAYERRRNKAQDFLDGKVEEDEE